MIDLTTTARPTLEPTADSSPVLVPPPSTEGTTLITEARRFVYLENALMSREMDRL
jgi:hypothetical protein